MQDKKQKPQTWNVQKPDEAFVLSRDAAAAWFYALEFEAQQDREQLKDLLLECFPNVDYEEVKALVLRLSPYNDVSDELINELLREITGPNDAILPYRVAMLRVLVIDFFSQLKSPRAILAEDGTLRVSRFLDEKWRGTTRNICQNLAGQRTKLRKHVRSLTLAMGYALHYRPHSSLDLITHNIVEVLYPSKENDNDLDLFPMLGLWKEDELNARGRLALLLAAGLLEKVFEYIDEIDKELQKASTRWRLSRISTVDLMILRIASYEILFEKAASPRILISDAVDLAKEYGAEQSKNFVNGILQQVCTNNEISS
ncbi:MAG: transcription antitermination factor NusB [Bradymonadales bacterium]|jgi:N utilization substance protein B